MALPMCSGLTSEYVMHEENNNNILPKFKLGQIVSFLYTPTIKGVKLSGTVFGAGVIMTIVNAVILIVLIVAAFPNPNSSSKSSWPSSIEGPLGALLVLYIVLSLYLSISTCCREDSVANMFKEGRKIGVFEAHHDLNGNVVYSWNIASISAELEK